MKRRFFSSWPMSAKLSALALVIALAFAALTLIALRAVKDLSSAVEEVNAVQGAMSRRGFDAKAAAYELQSALFKAIVAELRPGSDDQAALDAFSVSKFDAMTAVDALEPEFFVDGAQKESAAEVQAAYDAYVEAASAAVAALAEGKTEAALRSLESAGMDFEVMKAALDYLSQASLAVGDQSYASAVELSNAALRTLIAVAAAALLLIGFVVLMTARSIARPIGALVAYLDQAGSGDLSDSSGLSGADEIGRMSAGVDGLVADLRAMISTVKGKVLSLDDAGRDLSATMEETGASVIQINSSISNTRGRLQEQSASVEEVSAAIEELARNVSALGAMIDGQSAIISQSSAAVEEMIANTESAASQVERAGSASDRNLAEGRAGKSRIDEVTEAVASIVRYSDNLDEAVRVIQEIADRTNLLAMNAAIEAAHAGDSGKGFSVVADEIRKLAEQSTSQAKDISEALGMVRSSIDSVSSASRAAVDSFASILEGADSVGEALRGGGRAMTESREGARQVLEGLARLRDITREITGGSKEMSTGNDSILRQVARLRDINRVVVSNNDEITRGTMEINDAIAATIELSLRNRDLIGEVRIAADRFIVA
jgi:methyl-accepting chemotaxis protein